MFYKEAIKIAKEKDKKLLATDFSSVDKVFIKHKDGSELNLVNAFYEECDGWYLVFTEHLGVFAFEGCEVEIESIRRKV